MPIQKQTKHVRIPAEKKHIALPKFDTSPCAKALGYAVERRNDKCQPASPLPKMRLQKVLQT